MAGLGPAIHELLASRHATGVAVYHVEPPERHAVCRRDQRSRAAYRAAQIGSGKFVRRYGLTRLVYAESHELVTVAWRDLSGEML